MEHSNYIGLAAGTCTAISMIPQFIKSLREKKVDGISPLLMLVLLAGNTLWVWYGLTISNLPVIITNSFSTLMDLAMLMLMFIFRKKS